MICENNLNKILLIEKNKIKNNKTLFGSPLKKFINKIYNKFEIPKESFIISLFYIYNFYNNNKDNNLLISDFFDNVNIYIFTSIIISLKQLYDENINIFEICNTLNISYNKFIKYEIIILKGLDWNTSYLGEDFKNFVELNMDLYQDMDYLD
jgi:hypothetical protein